MKIQKYISTIIVLTIISTMVSCSKNTDEFYSTELIFPDFNSVTILKAKNVTIEYAEKFSVVIEGNESSIKDVKSEVISNSLVIDIDQDQEDNQDLKYIIKMPEIREVRNESTSNIQIGDFKQAGQLNIKNLGEGNIEIKQFNNITLLAIEIGNSGSITGNATFDSLIDLDIEINGSGDYDSYTIRTKNAIARINSTGSCFLYAIENLNAFINSSGSIHYKGNPVINEYIDGTGMIIDAN